MKDPIHSNRVSFRGLNILGEFGILLRNGLSQFV
jgi:hypothetical protein